mgnify:CR=1 FL=1
MVKLSSPPSHLKKLNFLQQINELLPTRTQKTRKQDSLDL